MWRRWRRRIARGLAVLGLAFVVLLGVVVAQGWVAFGKAASGERLERMRNSPQWLDGVFENPQPLWTDDWGAATGFLKASEYGSPSEGIPFVQTDPRLFDSAPPTGLRVTWLGHSTMLIEIEGRRILTDPVWGARTSPLTWIGPGRWYPPPIALDDLPSIDAVVISHDHYDHLDYPTIAAISGWETTFITPLGVASHLEYWGVPPERIVELDWWEDTTLGDLEIVCTPARHASGRTPFDQNATLWAGYAFVSPQHRVFFSGDTGLFPGMREIGERLGPFDLTMIEAGAYGQEWPDWHIGPEQAIRAHKMLRGKVFMPVHWGLFNLAFHAWTEPIERTLVAAAAQDVQVVAPRPGESFEPQEAPPVERWWPDVPWRTADEYPIVSTKVD